MKRLVSLLLVVLLMSVSLCACAGNNNFSSQQVLFPDGAASTPDFTGNIESSQASSQGSISSDPIGDADDSSLPPQALDEKGTISNPYSMNDTIEFIAYGHYSGGERSTFKFTNWKIHDDYEFEFISNDPDPLNKLVTFTLEIVNSSVNTPISVGNYIEFTNINDKGVEGGVAWLPSNMNELIKINDFKGLNLLPGFATESGTILYNSDGGNLFLISMEFYNEENEYTSIYIDPYK